MTSHYEIARDALKNSFVASGSNEEVYKALASLEAMKANWLDLDALPEKWTIRELSGPKKAGSNRGGFHIYLYHGTNYKKLNRVEINAQTPNEAFTAALGAIKDATP